MRVPVTAHPCHFGFFIIVTFLWLLKWKKWDSDKWSCLSKTRLSSESTSLYSSELSTFFLSLTGRNLGCLGGSAVDHLPLPQDVIPESWDWVTHRAHREPASFSLCLCLCLSLSLCVSHEWINKILKKKQKTTGRDLCKRKPKSDFIYIKEDYKAAIYFCLIWFYFFIF